VEPTDDGYGLVERHLTEPVLAYLNDFRVVVINGPRQSGKTTLLRELHARLGGTFASLDQPGDLAAAREDPIGFVESAARPLFIDEVQRAGDPLVRAVKLAVDADRRRGQFVLSGSTRFLTVPTLSESLAGRAALVDMWPFSVAELVGAPPAFVNTLFDQPRALLNASPAPMTRHEYMRVVCAGGFPEAVGLASGRSRSTWYGSYVRTVTQRDVREIARISRVEVLPRMLRLLAARTAQELNLSDVARGVEVETATARNYLALFETTYLVHQLSAWSGNLSARAIRRPKVYLTDTGLAAWLMGLSPDALARPGNAAAGTLLESFVVNEIVKLRDASGSEATAYHFRDRDQREVDLLLEVPDGRVVAVEVKASASVDEPDLRHLKYLQDRLGDRFVQGIVLYTGRRPLSFGDGLMALPINLLWGGRQPSLK
jgi:predicted AAA+ superfamily ATPase